MGLRVSEGKRVRDGGEREKEVIEKTMRPVVTTENLSIGHS